jgi:hypothetical protein
MSSAEIGIVIRSWQEVGLGSVGRACAVLAAVVFTWNGAEAQDRNGARLAYFGAVATYFELPLSEVAILGDWEIAPDEIPAVLFVARYAGVSPEALVALRRSGRTLGELVERYRLGASALHVPVRDQAPAGALTAAYERFRATPVADWRSIRLSDADIIALVNVRVLAQTLNLSAEDVIHRTGTASSYVELYSLLRRR